MLPNARPSGRDANGQRALRRGVTLDRRHDRAEAGDRACAEVITVAEAAGDHDRIGVAERIFLVPHQASRVTKDIAEYVNGVLVAQVEDGPGTVTVEGLPTGVTTSVAPSPMTTSTATATISKSRTNPPSTPPPA